MKLPTTNPGPWLGVYLVGSHATPGIYKIGITTRMDRRLVSLQSGSPVELHVAAFMRGAHKNVETSLHKRYHDRRLHGEWFQLDELWREVAEYLLGRRALSQLPPPLVGWKQMVREQSEREYRRHRRGRGVMENPFPQPGCCRALTKKGLDCPLRPGPSGWCHVHDPAGAFQLQQAARP